MNISFHGAARTVTGSKHLLHLDSGKKILLDCGMFQGMGRETLKLNKEWGFEPADVDYVVISHAHIDHIGLLPKLVKDGYTGKIFCTPATADLMKILLLDSAHIQEMEVAYINREREKLNREKVEALYTEDDAFAALSQVHTVEYNEPYKIDDDIELLYTDCGHVLGSAAVNLKINENGKEVRVAFSGDIGRYRDVILKSPEPFPQADYIIMESTYGDKLHQMITPPVNDILKWIEHTCIEKKGKLLIPAFSVGRTQEILYLLNRLDLEKRLPKINYFIDSPLSVEATEIIKKHPECFNANVGELLKKDDDVFSFEGLHYTKTAEESIQLTTLKEPCVIIAASGMAEAGRIKHHIAENINDAANSILIVGYCEAKSLGGLLKNNIKDVSIYGKPYQVKAEIGIIDSMSAHGDYDDLCQWLSCQDPEQVQKIFLVHGEYEVQVNFRERVMRKGFKSVDIPSRHQQVTIGDLIKEPI